MQSRSVDRSSFNRGAGSKLHYPRRECLLSSENFYDRRNVAPLNFKGELNNKLSLFPVNQRLTINLNQIQTLFL